MKKRLRHRVRGIGILFAFTVAITPTSFTKAAERNEARVAQAIHNVQLSAPHAGPRPASINDNVRQGTAVRTGSDSRAELAFTDRTLARLGANSLLSFGEGDSISRMAAYCCICRDVLGVRESTPRLRQRRAAVSQRWLSIVRNRGSIHCPRRPWHRLSQASSGRDSRAPRRANDNDAPGCEKVARTAGCRSFRVD